MKKYKKYTIIIAVCIILMPAIFSGCVNDPVRITPDKSENYDISIFFGSVKDPIAIDEMINKYNKDSGVSVEALVSDNLKQDVRYLNRLLDSENPPTGFIVSDDEQFKSIDDTGKIKKLSDINMEINIDAYPFRIDGYGLVIDKRIVPEIATGSDTDVFISDLIAASYAEWSVFVGELNSYIYNNDTSAYKLNGKSYSFPDKKGDLISTANGSFAFSGYDYTSLNSRLLNVIFSNIDLASVGDNIEHEKPIVGEGLDAYFEVLNTFTMNLSGQFAAGIRGADFITEAKYSQRQVLEMFGKGRAVFTIASTDDYLELSNIDAKRASNLAIIPIKIPTTADVILENKDGRLINSSIPLTSSSFLYANAQAESEQQEMLIDFVEWLAVYDAENNNVLEEDVKKYLESGNVSPVAIEGTLQDFIDRIEDDKLLNEFFTSAIWDAAQYDRFMEVFSNAWAESR